MSILPIVMLIAGGAGGSCAESASRRLGAGGDAGMMIGLTADLACGPTGSEVAVLLRASSRLTPSALWRGFAAGGTS
jgi:hypothetical protein